MEKLLHWVMENTNGGISVSKFKWGGGYTAFSISFEVTVYKRNHQIEKEYRYCNLANEMFFDDACKKALDKLKSGYLNDMGGDIIFDKIGGRYVDGQPFAELSFGKIVVKKE